MNDSASFLLHRYPRLAVTIFSLLLLVLTVMLVEAVLYLTPHRRLPLMQRHMLSIYEPDPINGFDLKPNQPPSFHVFSDLQYEVYSNSLGCFDEPFAPADAEDYILLVGDSFTWGYTPFTEKWGTQIERKLDQRVLKCGVSNYGTRHALNKARKVVQSVGKPPRLLLLGYYIGNDALNDFTFPGATVLHGYMIDLVKSIDNGMGEKQLRSQAELEAEYKRKRKPFKVWLKQNSILYNLFSIASRRLRNTLKGTSEGTNSYIPSGLYREEFGDVQWLRRTWPEHLANLVVFKKQTDTWNADLLVVIIPEKIQVYPKLVDLSSGSFDLERPNRILSDFLDRNTIPYLDLLPAFRAEAGEKDRRRLMPDKDLYWNDDEHWNIRGNHLAAEAITQAIVLRIAENGAEKARVKSYNSENKISSIETAQ
jgi:hypothetical protein